MNDSDSPTQDSWTLAQAVIDGHHVICRWKNGVSAPDESRPIKVTVRLGFTNSRPNGMPSPRDSEELQTIEEQLVLEMAGHDAEVVLVVTGNNAREFIGYCASHEWLNAWGPTVMARWSAGRTGTGLDAVMELDWSTFRAFAQPS